MSHYYDLQCLDCVKPEEMRSSGASWAGFDANRGHNELFAMLQLRPELEALGLAFKKLQAERETRLPQCTSLDSGAMLDTVPRAAYFFAEHVGHLVVVKSEYENGAFFGCDQVCVDFNKEPDRYRREVGPRENRSDCRLDFNHGGPCSCTRPDGK